MTQILLTFGFGLAGILPLIGFMRLAIRNRKQNDVLDAKVAERGHATATIGDVKELLRDIRSSAREARRSLFWDVVYVGGGVTLGAITSIISVWVL